MHYRAAPLPRTPWVTGLVLVVLGVPLLLAGAWLGMLGDTWYYLLAGLGFVLSGVLLMRRSPAALWVFAAVVGGTLAWALWETGLDWWPMAARGGVVFVIGLFLALPWIARSWPPSATDHDAGHVGGWMARSGRWALGSALGVFLVAAIVTWFHDDNRVVGMLPLPPMGASAASPAADAVPAGEWHAYGRTGHGQRYSPLAQITPDNVKQLEMVWQYRTGDMRGRPGDPQETTFEVTPLKVGNRLFFCTPHQSVIALDATTGAEAWRFNPEIQDKLALQHLTQRLGVLVHHVLREFLHLGVLRFLQRQLAGVDLGQIRLGQVFDHLAVAAVQLGGVRLVGVGARIGPCRTACAGGSGCAA